MSKFSDLLNTYIEEKGVKIYPLAQYCKIDRSAVYRFINGTRVPSEQSVVQQMADYLKLTPQQKSRFYEAWEIANTGEGLWYQRKATERFLLNFPKIDAPIPAHSWEFSENLLPTAKTSVVLNSKEEIRTSLEAMLIREAKSTKPELMLLLQPEHMDLSNLLLGDPRSNNFDICNIICLNNHNPSDAQNISAYNIKCLETLMPLYIHQKKLLLTILLRQCDHAFPFRQRDAMYDIDRQFSYYMLGRSFLRHCPHRPGSRCNASGRFPEIQSFLTPADR